MGGPPLLNGMSDLHRRLEKNLAAFKQKDDAILYTSGYQANVGWVTALTRPDDWIIFDELNHASFFDGLKMLKGAGRSPTAVSFAHNDVSHLLRQVARAREKLQAGGEIFVMVEGVYSMDGDLAPLAQIAEVCRENNCILVVDDAHGTGVLGPNGGGTAEHFGVSDQVDIVLGTFSKSFAINGAFITAKQPVIDYLRFFSRSYMFSAHLPQMAVAAALKGLELIQTKPEIRKALGENVNYLCSKLDALGFDAKTDSAIIPILIPQEIDIRELNKRFNDDGIFVNSIEFPAVRQNAQRLRLSVSAAHTRAHLDKAVAVFEKLGREFKLI
jgi:glycine C-acetyltransferase